MLLLFRRRLTVLGIVAPGLFRFIEREPVATCYKKLDTFHSTCWLKTVCNAWTTSYRMHEEVFLSCVFGCVSHKDKLEHYLECSVLWSLIDEVFLTSIGSSMLARCNISNPCESFAIMLTTAFNMYHTIKGGHRDLITASASSGRYGPVCKVGLDVARLYRARYNM